ncbi:hypothetical protein Moror_9258 [Moniliophthora roreri MCA 2997]|uniref:Uncharacterized protein n=1 Tax=Moniliophthora roreri (strain MCA 2997) TaxID=1381753 RepID=V2WTL8_MONRO|nr:hypothetical protein Moror_9258 [Moniliophthora roreri MCA 2997]
MVTTRSQAAKRRQPAETNVTPRRSKRIASKKARSVLLARKGKGKAAIFPTPKSARTTKAKKSKYSFQVPPRPKSAGGGRRVRLATPLLDGSGQRGWPLTPKAPRKPTQSLPRPILKPNYPARLSAPSSSFNDDERMTLTPTAHNSHVGNHMPARDETPLLGSPSQHTRPSPHDFCDGIPGTWTRSPSGTRRLVVIPDDVSAEANRERESRKQTRYDEIFREQYDLLMKGREESDRNVRGMLRNPDAMDCD